MQVIVCLVASLAIMGVAGCSEASPPSGAGVLAPEASSTTPASPESYQEVTFTTEDGIVLSGRLFGSGERAIILAHMYPADQSSWYDSAKRLAELGYLVLTFDFRGYGKSEGSKDIQYLDRDVRAAIGALAAKGAGQVLLVGASMGGTACLIAAATAELSSVSVTGVATLSAPVEFKGLSAAEAVPKLLVPLLFIAAEKDAGAEGAKALYQLSGNTGAVEIVPGKEHGTDLLKGAQADKVWELLLAFVRKNLPSNAR